MEKVRASMTQCHPGNISHQVSHIPSRPFWVLFVGKSYCPWPVLVLGNPHPQG
ncbi:hypothetical protein I79_016642 [Cricetulus griseus]|uniref:Uncharacterized protein n=1 Tax=Cricetulus griseus TaxID=10029 RepID=G3HZX8_CRIGR|nr:hypothetical protein I79_016642 [Cricetulus griseus]